MATSIFKLVGSVFVDTDKANDSLQKTSEKAQKTGVSFKEVAGKAAGIGTAVVAAAGAAVIGITSLASSAASTADTIDKASIRMGVSAESYQEYAHAAELAGVDTSTLEKAAKQLEGTDINFDDAMDSIMSLGTAEERSAKAAELFGDTVAYNMSPLIEQSADDFYNAKQEAEDLGLVLSNDTVKSGAELNDALSNVQDSFSALTTQLGASVMPLVTDVCNMIIEYMPTIQGVIQDLSPVVQEIFEELVPPLMDLVEALMPSLISFVESIIPMLTDIMSEIMPIIIQLIQTFLPIFMKIVEKLLPPLLKIVKAILPIFTKILDVISPILDVFMQLLDPFADLLEMLSPFITAMFQLIDEVLEPFMPLLKAVAQVLSGVLGIAIKGVTYAIGKAVDAIEWLVKKVIWLKNNWSNVWDAVGKKIKDVFNGIKEAIKTPINWIIEKINGVFSAIGEIDIPSWVPVVGGTKFSLPQIPTLATGGLVDGGQIFEARESGPELVGTYNSKSAVMNNDQIVAAVSKGVAEAVKSVFNNQDLADRIAEALQNSPLVANISASDLFTSVRNSNKNYVQMTGRSAF